LLLFSFLKQASLSAGFSPSAYPPFLSSIFLGIFCFLFRSISAIALLADDGRMRIGFVGFLISRTLWHFLLFSIILRSIE
jgi:hypothetical protein